MTPQQRAEWERLAAAATPGPWEARPFQFGSRRLGDVVRTDTPGGAAAWLYKAVSGTEADAAFIAAARDAVPALLAENERLRAAERECAGGPALLGVCGCLCHQVAALAEPEP